MTSVSPVSTVVDRLASLLARRPSALLSDYDGTLSPVALTPASAVLAPGVADSLAALAERVDLVGIVTGRAVDDAVARIGVPGLAYVGNHGLEWVEDGTHQVHPAGLGAQEALPEALREIEEAVSARIPLDGFIFEDKTYSASIHYRLVEDPARAGEVLGGIVNDVAQRYGLWVSPGKMVVELRPGERINKGTAVRRLANDHQSRAMVFLGDDVTDTDAFIVLRELRADGRVDTVSVGVLTPDTHPLVIDHSDYLLDGVNDVVAVLEALASRLPELKGVDA